MSNPRTNHAHGFNLAVAQQLEDARVDKSWTVEALAAQIPDISLRALERYLSGEAAISIEKMDLICEAIGVPMSDVIQAAEKAYRAGEVKPRATRQKVRRSLDEQQRADRRAGKSAITRALRDTEAVKPKQTETRRTSQTPEAG